MDDRLPGIGEAKVCCTCKQVKPLSDFNLLRKPKDGRQYSCRACNKAYHYANWDRHMEQIRARKARRQAENRRLVLEFDHLRD